MFLLLPFRTNVPFDERLPLVNLSIIGAIIVAFIVQVSGGFPEQLVLDGWRPLGIIGHMWLHADLLHLTGNVWFLWLFGNAVNVRLGHARFAALYLGAGLAGAFAHLIFGNSPAIGASGAINGIVGAYLIMYPLASVDCLYLFFVKGGSFAIAGRWLVLFYLILDLWGAATGGGRIAYWAHLGGFALGAAAAVFLLKSGIVTMERWECSMLEAFSGRQKRY